MAEIENKVKVDHVNNIDSDGHVEDYDSVIKYDKELSKIKQDIIDRDIQGISEEGYKTIFRAGIPSLLLLILSFFIGVADVPFMGNIFETISKYINPGQEVLNTEIQPITLWWFPFIVYIIFIFCAIRANIVLRKEISLHGASETSITRIIDRYSGIVDGIGTALPLLGAAILLISIEKGPAVFLGFAVPFEIKSILILAIAKLFDSLFDALALKYQEIQEKVKTIERVYYYQKEAKLQRDILEKMFPVQDSKFPQGPITIESSVTEEQLSSIYETMKTTQEMSLNIKDLISEINNLKLPDEKILKELQTTSKFLGETIQSLNDNKVLKSLDNLVYLSGKREAREI